MVPHSTAMQTKARGKGTSIPWPALVLIYSLTARSKCSLALHASPLFLERVAPARQSRLALCAQKNAIISRPSLFHIQSNLHPQQQYHIHNQPTMGKQQGDITTLGDIPTLDECYGKYPKPTQGTSIRHTSFSISLPWPLHPATRSFLFWVYRYFPHVLLPFLLRSLTKLCSPFWSFYFHPGELAYAPNANWNERISMWYGGNSLLIKRSHQWFCLCSPFILSPWEPRH